MTPNRQTIFVATNPKGRGNCMAACLASIMDLPLAETIDTTSDEVRADWFGEIQKWLGDRGLRLRTVYMSDPTDLSGCYSVGIGPSPRGPFNHAVVCKNGVMVFDPHHSDDGVLHFSHHEILVPLTGAEKQLHARGALNPDPRAST